MFFKVLVDHLTPDVLKSTSHVRTQSEVTVPEGSIFVLALKWAK